MESLKFFGGQWLRVPKELLSLTENHLHSVILSREWVEYTALQELTYSCQFKQYPIAAALSRLLCLQ